VFSVARALPWLELVLGVLLLAGLQLRLTAVATATLLAGFYAAMIYAYSAGSGIDCGCFGVGEAVSARTLVRDGALLAAAVALVISSGRRRRLTLAMA
jgi:uncharacterized membrane protein YphA (DoxX/SURF4 family)